jgi:hypothetical protein
MERMTDVQVDAVERELLRRLSDSLPVSPAEVADFAVRMLILALEEIRVLRAENAKLRRAAAA